MCALILKKWDRMLLVWPEAEVRNYVIFIWLRELFLEECRHIPLI